MKLLPFVLCLVFSCTNCFQSAFAQTDSSSSFEVLDITTAADFRKSKVIATAHVTIVGSSGAGVEGVGVTIAWGESRWGTSTSFTDVDGVATFTTIQNGRRFSGEVSASVIWLDGSSSVESIVEEPIVEEPIVEEPIVEEPIVEEPIVEEPVVEEPQSPVGGIYVEGQQIVSASAGPMVLKGVNFEASWKYTQGEKLEEVAKTGANSVRIVWNIWQDTNNLSQVMDKAIANGLFPILELSDATLGRELATSVGDVAAFRQVVSWWVSEDVKNVLLPYQDQMIVNISNETFSTDFGLNGFVDEYTSAIRQLREAGYTTHLMIDAPQWGQDYRGGVSRLKELQKIDSNISLGVHLYDSFLPDNAIDELFEYMDSSGVPWIVGEFSIQTPGCGGEIDYQRVMRLANLYQVGYQAWSWGHGNSDCPSMDMTLPNGDFDNLTAWGRVVADDLANSPSYLLSLTDFEPDVPNNEPEPEPEPEFDPEFEFEPEPAETVILIRARGDVGQENLTLIVGGVAVQQFSVSTAFQTFTYVGPAGISAVDVQIQFVENIRKKRQDPNLVVDYIEVNEVRFETEAFSTFSTGAWSPEAGAIVPGFGIGETLHTTGYFQYDSLTP